MSTTRIEGCLWHSPSKPDEKETDSVIDGQKFLQLIAQKATHSPPSSCLSGAHRRQCYRVVSKNGEGIVCEVNERDGELHLCIQVPERALFDTLSLVSSWLCARLHEAGHAVFLEVKYVKDNPSGVEPGAASSS